MSSNASDQVIVLGSRFAAGVVAKALLDRGTIPHVLVHEPRELPPTPVYWGNGDSFENARLVMGDSLTEDLWRLSQASYARAKELLVSLGLPAAETGLVRYGADQRDEALLKESAYRLSRVRFSSRAQVETRSFFGKLEEPAFVFDPVALGSRLEQTLANRGVTFERADHVDAVEREGTLSAKISYRAGGVAKDRSPSVLIFVSDEAPAPLLPVLQDKWIPVTLTSLLYAPGPKAPEAALSLFNRGADFASRFNGVLRAGSFRNLYEDKAVGIHTEEDPKTRLGVESFFKSWGWLGDEQPRVSLSVEAMSCDGLGLVGALADLPGVYVVGAFAGRTANYLFEIAEGVAEGIVHGRNVAYLSPFSTKRFL